MAPKRKVKRGGKHSHHTANPNGQPSNLVVMSTPISLYSAACTTAAAAAAAAWTSGGHPSGARAAVAAAATLKYT